VAEPVCAVVAPLTTGSGFKIDSVIDPEALVEAWLTAVIVTVFGLGIADGGV
jgi:hypothetical protein